MRKLIVLPLFICISLTVAAQKSKDNNIPAFGKVEKAELEIKECDFDKNAEAMVLFSKGELNCTYNLAGTYIDFIKHVRIKILNDKGTGQADIHIPYSTEGYNVEVKDIEAQVYNLDAEGNIITTRVEKKSIYDHKLNKWFSEKAFTFPGVKAGSIIEYKYVISNAGIVNWYFQLSIPVKYSEFIVDFPNEIEVHTEPKCSRQYEKDQKITYARTTQFFAMREIPGLRNEPFILNEALYMDRIESNTVAYNINGKRRNLKTSWVRIINNLLLHNDFGMQLNKDIPTIADLEPALKSMNSPYSKMKLIHKYVREHLKWNGIEGIWSMNGVKSTWKYKTGSTGDINLILVNLLKDAGLNARPILVSTHENGIITKDPGTNRSPGYLQFNKVLAWVEIDSAKYVLDGTDKETPPHLIPLNIVFTEGLVLDKGRETFKWAWKEFWHQELRAKNLIHIQGIIDAGGQMKGEVSIHSFDYARIMRVADARKNRKEFSENHFSSNNPDVKIENVTLTNLEDDSLPLIQKVFFSQQLNSSGDYRYFSSNIFTGLEVNPFVADKRESDVFFGVKQEYIIIGSFSIHEGYEFESLPRNMRMVMPDSSIIISRLSETNHGTLSLRIKLEFFKPLYTVDIYPDFKEFYKKLQDILNEQYVIRKKTSPKP